MRRHRRGVLAILLGSSLLGAPAAAEVQPSPRFAWERGPGAEQCPTEPELRERIVALAGRDPFATPEGPSVTATVDAKGPDLVAIIRARRSSDGPVATRELRSAAGTCTALANAVVLAVALALEEKAPPSPDPEAPANVPPAAEPIDVDTGVPPAADSHAELARRAGEAKWGLQVEALWNIGWLPRSNTGLGGGLHLRIGDRAKLVAGGLWLPAESEAGQFTAGLTSAMAGACIEAPRGARFAAEHCVLGFAGAWRLEAEASATLDHASGRLWSAGGASSAISIRSSEGLTAEIGIMGIVPFERPIYRSTSCPPAAFQQPFAALGAFFSLGMSIW